MSTYTVKLNDAHRAAIRKQLLEDKFGERKRATETGMANLAQNIFERYFTKTERSLMKDLPAGWLPEIDTIRAKVGGIEFYHKLPEGVTLRIPHKHYGHQRLSDFLLMDDHEICRIFDTLRQSLRSIELETAQLTQEIQAVLHSVTTSNKLITVWPEIRVLVEKVCRTTSTVNLPAPRVEHLNKALGLVAA